MPQSAAEGASLLVVGLGLGVRVGLGIGVGVGVGVGVRLRVRVRVRVRVRAFLLVVVVASVDLLVHRIDDGRQHLVRVRVRGRARVHGVEHLVRVGVRGRVRVHASAGGPTGTGACDMCTCMRMHMHLDACVHGCVRARARVQTYRRNPLLRLDEKVLEVEEDALVDLVSK